MPALVQRQDDRRHSAPYPASTSASLHSQPPAPPFTISSISHHPLPRRQPLFPQVTCSAPDATALCPSRRVAAVPMRRSLAAIDMAQQQTSPPSPGSEPVTPTPFVAPPAMERIRSPVLGGVAMQRCPASMGTDSNPFRRRAPPTPATTPPRDCQNTPSPVTPAAVATQLSRLEHELSSARRRTTPRAFPVASHEIVTTPRPARRSRGVSAPPPHLSCGAALVVASTRSLRVGKNGTPLRALPWHPDGTGTPAMAKAAK